MKVKSTSLLHLLVETPRLSLMEIFKQSTCKAEIVCTFIAVLELIRLKEIIVIQHRQFEDIEILRNTANETPAEAAGLIPLMEELKRIVLNQESEEDQVVSLSLRPQRLDDFVGQPDLVKGLRVAMAAAQKRSEPLEHTLFSGPPGLGKTSLAHIIANEMNSRITITSGPAIDRAGDFIGILTNLEKGDVLFH